MVSRQDGKCPSLQSESVSQMEETEEESDRSQREEAQGKRQRTETSESELELEAASEASRSSPQSHTKKGNMTNILLTDPDEEMIVDFVKDHGELYDQ